MAANEIMELNECNFGLAVKSLIEIPKNTVLFKIVGIETSEKSRYTIQTNEKQHISPGNRLWGYINHLCEPNCIINFDNWTFVSARAINKNEELTFNYLTTEWDMAEPFECQCKSPDCYGHIRGFKYLNNSEKRKIIKICSPYLINMYNNSASMQL